MLQILVLFSTLALMVCFLPNPEKTGIYKPSKESVKSIKELTVLHDTALLEEFFADSIHIGKKSLNKIEIAKYRILDSNYVIIRFYARMQNTWSLKNEFRFEKDYVSDCNPKISDFNNDGFSDVTYVSATAARGANEIRRLFIYDKKNDRLTYIINSEDYPNMLYNKELNCIDAFLVYGGCSTVFLQIQGDRLRKFASVELMDGLTVRTYDKNGNEKVIFQDSTHEAGYIRYKRFKPLKEYDYN